MDAQQFLAEFAHIANAPGGVERLRELVLSLAVEGRLVPQIAVEEPADSFLTRLPPILQPSGRRGSRSSILTPQGSNAKLPSGWVFTSLGRLGYPQAGFAFKSAQFNQSGNGLPIVRVRDVGVNAPQTFYSGEYREEFIVKSGDWLIAMDGDFRVAEWRGQDALLNQRVTRIQFFSDEIEKKYVCIALQFELHKLQGVKNYTTVDHLSGGQISNALIPLPPPKEQSRIVAKVDELMVLCDQLEQQHQDRRQLQNALRQSFLQAVANAQSPHELQDSWDRLGLSFARLFSEPQDVNDVIAELKNLAVYGLLADASAEKPDLGRIRSDCAELREQYLDAGLMRKQKLVGMAQCERTYPRHWSTVAFDEVAVVIGGVTKGRDLQGKETTFCPYLAVTNVQRGYFKLDGIKSIEIAVSELPKYVVQEGDLLITEGGDWDKVGRTAIWHENIENCLHQNHVFKARIPSPLLKKEWVELVFNSGVGRNYFAGASKQTTNLASINMTQLRSFPLPVPPLDEQERVLATLSELIAQCVEWRHQIERKQALSAQFANAAVAALTGITIEQEEEVAVKAPQTELIASLRLGTPPDVKAQAPLATILVRHNGMMSARDLWQRFGGNIDAFYAQLKTEVAHGWIVEPEVAEMREKYAESVET